jgi:hypothetical protein
MSQSYSNLPLQCLLNKNEFNSATEICISTYALDMTFINTYLTDLRKDVILFVDYAKTEEEVLEYFNKAKIGKLKLFRIPSPAIRSRKEILIRTRESFLSLLTSSNLTQIGLEDEFGQHLHSCSQLNYSVKKIQFVLRRIADGWNPAKS